MNGNSTGNVVQIDSCKFEYCNKALWRGGLFLEFRDATDSNMNFTDNECNYTKDFVTAGGGMRIG